MLAVLFEGDSYRTAGGGVFEGVVEQVVEDLGDPVGGGVGGGTGRHYLGSSLNAPDLGGSDLSPSLFWVANLTDGSGIVTASVRYGGLDYITPEAGLRYTYGPEGGEYSGFGTGANLSIGFTLRAPF